MGFLKIIKRKVQRHNKYEHMIENLALENVRCKNQVKILTSQLEDLTQMCVKMAEKINAYEKTNLDLGNIDERLMQIENAEVTHDDIRQIATEVVIDHIPDDLDDVIYAYNNYNFDEFLLREDFDDETSRFITRDDLDDEMLDVIKNRVYDCVVNDECGKVIMRQVIATIVDKLSCE